MTMMMSGWTSKTTSTPTLTNELFHALHMVETGGRLGPIKGDGGRALGPLQIHKVYWTDANIAGKYEDCADLEYSKKVVRAYMARYAVQRRLGRTPTAQDIARIHNGGPNGYKRKATLGYWRKVKGYLK